MNIDSYSSKETTEKCKQLKVALDSINETVKKENAVSHTTVIRNVLEAEYLKTCLFQERKQMPSFDIQQWYDSK